MYPLFHLPRGVVAEVLHRRYRGGRGARLRAEIKRETKYLAFYSAALSRGYEIFRNEVNDEAAWNKSTQCRVKRCKINSVIDWFDHNLSG